MLKHPVQFVSLLVAAILVFSVSGCKNSPAQESPTNNQYDMSDPLVVAEYALKYISDGNIEGFMDLTPYYKSSYFYSELRSLVEAYIEETGGVKELSYEYCSNYDVDQEVKKAFKEEGIDEITTIKFYSFLNAETNEWVDIYVGKIGNQWSVCTMEYYVP